jgi:hypothetical protein
MAETDEDVPAGDAGDAGADEATMPLNEWCQEQSRDDKRVELLAVFAFRERAAGRVNDTASAYRARFSRIHRSPTTA